MHLRPQSLLLIILYVSQIASAASPFAFPLPDPLPPSDRALTLYHQAAAKARRASNILRSPTFLSNQNTTTPPPLIPLIPPPPLTTPPNTTSTITKYKISTSPTTLEFHHLGARIPAPALLQTVTLAIERAFTHVAAGEGGNPIDSAGYFRYQKRFLQGSGGVVDFAVGDFREVGRPMTWFALCDVLRGVADFMMERGDGYREARFEVLVEGVGYAGSGRVEYREGGPVPTGGAVA